ncbi:MAG: DsbA family protein [Betaproteobacteria bacterium]|nr:MAG: DsbA family protein [Betaproteobacteria bacterium]
MTTETIELYIDHKSPYAYLAVAPAWELERDFDVTLDWLPYTLDIPDFLGSAKVADDGTVLEQNRTEHQWRRVKYSYMDVRRYANLRGITVRGPQKIWDSSVSGIGMLWAKAGGGVRKYNDIVYERFWKRALDIEDVSVIEAVLNEVGVDTTGFADWAAGEGRALHDRIRVEAEQRGVFGVPTFVVDDEIFWGREHLALIRLRLYELGLARPGVQHPLETSHAWVPRGD